MWLRIPNQVHTLISKLYEQKSIAKKLIKFDSYFLYIIYIYKKSCWIKNGIKEKVTPKHVKI